MAADMSFRGTRTKLWPMPEPPKPPTPPRPASPEVVPKGYAIDPMHYNPTMCSDQGSTYKAHPVQPKLPSYKVVNKPPPYYLDPTLTTPTTTSAKEQYPTRALPSDAGSRSYTYVASATTKDNNIFPPPTSATALPPAQRFTSTLRDSYRQPDMDYTVKPVKHYLQKHTAKWEEDGSDTRDWATETRTTYRPSKAHGQRALQAGGAGPQQQIRSALTHTLKVDPSIKFEGQAMNREAYKAPDRSSYPTIARRSVDQFVPTEENREFQSTNRDAYSAVPLYPPRKKHQLEKSVSELQRTGMLHGQYQQDANGQWHFVKQPSSASTTTNSLSLSSSTSSLASLS